MTCSSMDCPAILCNTLGVLERMRCPCPAARIIICNGMVMYDKGRVKIVPFELHEVYLFEVTSSSHMGLMKKRCSKNLAVKVALFYNSGPKRVRIFVDYA